MIWKPLVMHVYNTSIWLPPGLEFMAILILLLVLLEIYIETLDGSVAGNLFNVLYVLSDIDLHLNDNTSMIQ